MLKPDRLALLIACIGFVCCLIAFYPGVMTPDPIWQYSQALTQQYNDWHPPMMAWWWHWLNYLTPGPLPYLIQNLLCYWGALLIFYYAFKALYGKGALGFPLLGFLPCLISISGIIWKDVALATSMMLALSILSYFYFQQKKVPMWIHVILVLLFFYAVGVKTNVLTALPFFTFFWAYVTWPGKARPALIFAIITTALFALAYQGFVHLIHAQAMYRIQNSQIYDLMGLSYYTHTLLLPAYLLKAEPHLTLDWLMQTYPQYQTQSVMILLFGPVNGHYNPMTQNLENLKALQQMWLQAVSAHPWYYLDNRTQLFMGLLRLGDSHGYFFYQFYTQMPAPYFQMHPNILTTLLYYWIRLGDYLGLFLVWMHEALLLFVLFLCYRKTFRPEIRRFLMICIYANLAFVLPHFFLAPDADFRYLYWPVALADFCILISILEYFRPAGPSQK